MLKRIWHDPVWSKVIAAAILTAAGALAYHLDFWPILKRWVLVFWAFLLSTSPVPHWVLGVAILIVVVAIGMIFVYVWSFKSQDRFARLEAVTDVAPVEIEPPVIPARPKPNLLFLRARSANVDYGEYQFRETNDATDMLGVVACFRNEPILDGPRVCEARFVTANIIYRDSEQGGDWGRDRTRVLVKPFKRHNQL